MSVTVFSSPPKTIVQGDSYSWSLTAASASEIISYGVRNGEGDGVVIRGINDGTDHLFTLTPAASASLDSGRYSVSRVVEDGAGNRETYTAVSTLDVRPDPLINPDESQTQKMVRLLEQALIDRVNNGLIESRSIGGLSVGKMSTSELEELLNKYRVRLLREKSNGRAGRGQAGFDDILVKF